MVISANLHGINIKKLSVCIAIPLGVGFLSSIISGSQRGMYESIIRPPLSPPAIVFPIVWTILYTLMGISCYLVSMSDLPDKSEQYFFYGVQLFLNFFWPVIFFGEKSYLLAFIWLLLLIGFVAVMIWKFAAASKTAALLQIPYMLWLLFAAYLNFGVWLLNS